MIRPTSGMATRAAVLYGQWSREAVRRAGRPVMPITGHAMMAPGEIAQIGPQHIKFKQQTNQHSLFMAGLVNQAVARNSRIIATTTHTTSGRPGSSQYAFKFSALAMDTVTSGSNITGLLPAQPLGYNNESPLMARLFAELAHGAAKMTRAEAAPVIEKL